MVRRWIQSVDVEVDDQGRIGIIFPSEAITGSPPYTLADLYDRLDDGLFEYDTPFFQVLRGDLDYYLCDQNDHEPWLQVIHYDLETYLYDWENYQPWLKTIYNEVLALRAVLEDVYDAAQHALRTV